MKNTKKTFRFVLVLLLAAVYMSSDMLLDSAFAATKFGAAQAKWSRFEEYKNNLGGRFRVRATLYTADYIESLMQEEAEKNLWTASELEDYKYNFLKGLHMDDYIAIHLELEELGPTAHMSPFNEMVYLWIGKNKYTPTDYDQRFNFPLQGKRDGLVFFPRFDEKTGEALLKKDVTLRLIMKSAVSPVLDTKEVRFVWDVKAENVAADTFTGTAADRIEVDRLLKRVEKLSKEKADLEAQLGAKNRELEDVTTRIEELQKK